MRNRQKLDSQEKSTTDRDKLTCKKFTDVYFNIPRIKNEIFEILLILKRHSLLEIEKRDLIRDNINGSYEVMM